MYNIKLESYVPAPKPATSDRIVAAHYYAAWKKGAAGLHDAFNDLADEYPERTPLMGYYDEENPEVCDWEIKWALEHGINCFIYCWYRYQHNMGKPVTVKDLRCAHGIHEALFNAKYGDMMKFALMFENSLRWCGTDERDMLENLMPFWMENYFTQKNYLVIDNKPVLFVYYADRFTNECYPDDPAAQKRLFDACRDYARGFGFDGMIFAACKDSPDKASHDGYMERGFDFRFGYSSGYKAQDNNPPEDDIINEQLSLLDKNLAIDEMNFVPTPSCFRDSRPRYTDHWYSLGYTYRDWDFVWYLYPDKYRELLERVKARTDELPDGAWGKKIVMIDNWNEWDEGHYVSPSHKFGYQYLQAIREVFTARDNLPDYRTPKDQGLGDYNTSWRTPDFKEICEKKIQVNFSLG